MAHQLNPFINFNGQNGDNTNEQSLIDGFVTETIQQMGVPIKYMPRTLVKEDSLYGEDVLSAFNADAFDIEMYVETIDSFEGDSEIIMSFGIMVKDTIKLRCSRSRFIEEATDAAIELRPAEGDLLYMTMGKSLFEIKFVEDEDQFYPNGVLPSFLITAEKFDYSMETFNTGDADIDSVSFIAPTDEITPADGDNQIIEDEAAAIIDFDEANPFGGL